MKAKRSKFPPYIWASGLGFLLLVLIFYAYEGSGDDEEADYLETRVERGDLQITVLTVGEVQPQNRLAISATVDGRLEKMLVKEGERVKAGQVLAWVSSKERASLLDAARSHGKDEVEHWETVYKPTPIIAPMDGTVISRKIEEGQSFTPADPLLFLSNRLMIQAYIDETDLSKLELNQKAEITLDAYPDQTFEAQVVKIAFDAIKSENVTYFVIDLVSAEDSSFMRSGMSATINVLIEKRQNALLLDSQAISSHEGKTYALLKNSVHGGDPILREVTVGVTDGKKSEILSGIREGETALYEEVIVPEEALD